MDTRKTLLNIAAAAAVTAVSFTASAHSDHIEIFRNGDLDCLLRTDLVDAIRYTGNDPDGGFTHMCVDFKDGSQRSLEIEGIQAIQYAGGMGDNPVKVTVEPHHMCATLHIESSEPDRWYRAVGLAESELAGIDETLWGYELFEVDRSWLHQAAEAMGRKLSSFSNADVFDCGTQALDWFPYIDISPGTDVALCVYTGHLEGNDVVMDSEPELIRFTLKTVEDCGVRFDLSADMTSNRLTVKADAQDGADIPFAIEIYTPDQIVEYGLAYLVASSLRQMEQMVYTWGMSWDDVTFRRHGEVTRTNCRAGDELVAVAFGVEYGFATTDASWASYIIPEAEVTDPCTFDISVEALTTSEAKVNITPSSADTRWAAMLVETSRLEALDAEDQPGQWVANQIYWINYTNRFQWNDTDYVHQGAASLNSHDGLIDGVYLKAGVQYTVLVFGLDETSMRTTAVGRLDFTPEAMGTDLGLEVSFTGFERSNQWTSFISVEVHPDDPDATYVIGSLRSDNRYAQLDCTDREFMDRYSEAQGQWLELNRGDKSKRLSFSSEFDNDLEEWVFGSYIVFVYGYDGAPTSALHCFEVNTGDGTVTRLR